MAKPPTQQQVRLWRESVQDPLAFPTVTRYRTKTILFVFALSLALVGLLVGLLFWIRPKPNPLFVPLVITKFEAPQIPLIPHVEADRDALGNNHFFFHEDTDAYQVQSGNQLLHKLDDLKNESHPIVIYLATRAIRAGKGEIYLLPADANADNRSTWIAFSEVLQRIATCPSSYKLLLLDIAHANAEPRLGRLENNVADAIAGEIKASGDTRLLVLSSCSPGQVALTSDALERSVFSYYVEQGLRGWADGFLGMNKKDGRVSAKELAAFVGVRVDRWALENRSVRQTPLLLGDGADFNLHSFDVGQRDIEPKLPKIAKYPKWLAGAWKEHHTNFTNSTFRLTPFLFRYQSALLMRAEDSWRGGVPADQLQSGSLAVFSKIQNSLARKRTYAMPLAQSLAPAGNAKADDAVANDLKALFIKMDTATRNMKPDQAKSKHEEFIVEFLKTIKKKPFIDIARAVFARAAALKQPTAKQLQLLDGILQAVSPEPPKHYEILLLHHLAGMTAPDVQREASQKATGQLLKTTAVGESATISARGFPWNKNLLEEAAQLRHDGELRFLARGYAAPQDAGELLQSAAAGYERILAQSAAVEQASAVLDDAVWFLPFYRAYLESHLQQEPQWLNAMSTARRLYNALSTPTADPAMINNKINEIRRYSGELQNEIAKLREPFLSPNVQRLLAVSALPRAKPATWHEMEALLKTPFVAPDDREKLQQVQLRLGRRLHRTTAVTDAEDNKAGAMLTELPPYDPAKNIKAHNVLRRKRARWMLELFALADLRQEIQDRLKDEFDKAVGPKSTEQDWYNLEAMIRNTWGEEFRRQYLADPAPVSRDRLLRLFPPLDGPPQLDIGQLTDAALVLQQLDRQRWSWQADRYRYQARDYRGIGLPSESVQSLAEFMTQAAAVYGVVSPPPPEHYLQIIGGFGIPLLSPLNRSASSQMQIQAVGAVGENSAVTMEMISARRNWLNVVPQTASLKFAANRMATAPFTVALRPGADTSPFPPPQGFLAQFRRSKRSFHRRVSVPLRKAQQLQILVSTNPVEPDPPLESIRLRPSKVKQHFYIYVFNDSDEAEGVIAQVLHKGEAIKGAEAKFVVASKKSQRMPMATPAGGKITLAPYDGPLVVRLLDVRDKTTVIAERTIDVAVANPREYVTVSNIVYIPGTRRNAGINRLQLKLQNTASVSGPPIPAELELPPDRIPGLVKITSGTFKGTLKAQIQFVPDELALFAQQIKLAAAAEREGIVYVHVDGFKRAFIFRTTFERNADPLTPRGDLKPAVRFRAAGFAKSNPKFALTAEVDNAPAGAKLEVRLGRLSAGTFQSDLVENYPGPKDKQIGFAVAGGGLLFEASLEDWKIFLDTSKIVGPRQLQARLLDAAGEEIAKATQDLTFDATPPTGVQLVRLPQRAKKESKIIVESLGGDSDSGIAEVSFFVGTLEKGKIPPNIDQVKGKPIDEQKRAWAAELPLPDVKGPVPITVVMVNRAGLMSFDTKKITLTDFDPDKVGPSNIKGKVVMGTQAQPLLEVQLINVAGRIVAKTKTNAKGEYLFAKVKPGRYRVYTRKRSSLRQGYQDVDVEPNRTVEATLNLSLIPGRQ